jgi:hypothetical protein
MWKVGCVITGSIPSCAYGGYTLSTERDVKGDPLEIVQQTELGRKTAGSFVLYIMKDGRPYANAKIERS